MLNFLYARGMKKNPDLAVAFGKVLKKQRLQLGLSQNVLIEKADLSIKGLRNLEYGRRAPTLSTVIVLAEGLGMQPCDLVRMVTDEMSMEKA